MPDSFEDQAWVKLGVASALAKEYAGDQRQFLALLAKTFQEALPGEAEIKTRGFFSNKTVVAVIVNLGEYRYTVEDPGRGPILASRTKIVRGIALKTEQISVQNCLDQIGEALEERVGKSAEGRNALADLLGLQ